MYSSGSYSGLNAHSEGQGINFFTKQEQALPSFFVGYSYPVYNPAAL